MSSDGSYTIQLSPKTLVLAGALIGVSIGFGAFGILLHLRNSHQQKEREQEQERHNAWPRQRSSRSSGTRRSQQFEVDNFGLNASSSNKHAHFADELEHITDDDENDEKKGEERGQGGVGGKRKEPLYRATTADYQHGAPIDSPLGFQRLVRHNTAFSFSTPAFAKLGQDDQIKILQAENARLNNLVTMSIANRYGASGSNDILSASDIETLRAVFDSCDTEALGSVTMEQIDELMKRLGEPLNEEELKELMKSSAEKQKDDVERISFNSFLMWWANAHKGGKRSDRYRKMFKFKQAKLNLMGDFDIDHIIATPVGPKGNAEFRVMFKYQQQNGKTKQISPWHDIPLRHGQTHIYNFICEIPKWTRAKYEIATGETFNPIRQDVKNGKLRFYEHGDMMWNYGAFPQTWENPEHIPEDTKYPGDNDPLDVIELGTRQLPTGSVTAVKVLGILALLDSGETDWKVLAINIKDPLANVMQDVHDIDKHMPGCIDAMRDWLRIYKVCTGAVENQYALRGEALNEEYAKRVIEETHQQWQQLNEEGRREVSKQ